MEQGCEPRPSAVAADGRTPTLTVWKDGARLDTVVLQPGTHSVGRSEGAAIVVEHPSCSRQHATISVTAGLQVSITDLGSAQGTFVDNVELEPHKPRILRDCAKLVFGVSSRSFLLHVPAAVDGPPRSSGLSVNEKRKLLWGGKRAAAAGSANSSSYSRAAGALGDSERADRFLALTGAKRHRDEGGASAAEEGGANSAAAAARQQQDALFTTLERQYEQARGNPGRRSM